ncbi:tetratricopeptide repeat protein [Pedobacter sp. SYSU D00535]|uniref:type IX secretion system periplasmic lipoprotein PorW/SprE n=1 Tax=Pedobacter sp. SYSU D00535 TaxID=2810308 RepID=UPI001A968191|nr:tetratricopeptide repeat protein [Pedobacter sp. SYSU D00535]
MQNLTARYNIIYNARILLDQSQRDLDAAIPDDYSQILPVQKEPTEAAAQNVNAILDSVIFKANTIVNDKLYSRYVDDAYFLIAEANHYKANFFNAAEFFNYVHSTYPKSVVLRQASLIGQARSLIQLEKYQEAAELLDTARKYVDSSKKLKGLADNFYATDAQLLIRTEKETEAIEMLKKAIKGKATKQNRIRWTFILAQLQERNNQLEEAYTNYRKVVKSNAPFDMAFNAALNRIGVEDRLSGQNADQISRLRSMIRNEKNKDFIDQIYARMGDIYADRNENERAIENYNQSIRQSTRNQNQKGLSYLKIADIHFRNGDYVTAKSYYDSTTATLSPSFAGYDLIRKKASNLDLLANRYRVVGREDTLQMLARLPEAEREERIAAFIRLHKEKSAVPTVDAGNPGTQTAALDQPALSNMDGKFYFNNSSALAQGALDFRKRWGNRKLEDNWRRSTKSLADANAAIPDDPDAPVGLPVSTSPSSVSPEVLRNSYISNLPFTETAVQASNQRIAEAYYDIATFYKDELKDNREAIKTFERLLTQVPESTYKLPVYYHLYRLYSTLDEKKSEEYKNYLLSRHPESPFARVIKDPQFSSRDSEKDAELSRAYNQIYDLYVERKYDQVLEQVSRLEQQFGNNRLSPQLAYLSSLSLGHLQKLPAFESSLQQLTANFQDDKFITPLVKQQLEYIAANRDAFTNRPTALTDFNPDDSFYIEPVNEQKGVWATTQPIAKPAPSTASANEQAAVSKQPEIAPVPQNVNAAESTEPTAELVTGRPVDKSTPTVKPAYTLPESGEYYFIVNVMDAGANLNSSRFGIGQFNRSRFSGMQLKHQLKNVNNENQLIYIGSFSSLNDASSYEKAILPLIRDIIKQAPEKYNTFVITKDELEKLNNNAQITAYQEFYKNSR